MANGLSAMLNNDLLRNLGIQPTQETSIVDSMKALGMDSSPEARQELSEILNPSTALQARMGESIVPTEMSRIPHADSSEALFNSSSPLPETSQIGSLMNQFSESGVGKLTKSMGGVGNIASTGLQIYNMMQQGKALKEAKTGIEGAMDGLDSLRADTVSSEVEAIENLEKEMKSTIGNKSTTLRGSLKTSLDRIPTSNIQTGSIQAMADNARNTIQNALDSVVDQAKSRFDSGRSYEDQKTRDALGRIESTRTQLASELDKIEQARKQLPVDMAMKGLSLLGPAGKTASTLYDIGKGFRT